MPPLSPQVPEPIENPELEALAELGVDSNEKLGAIETNGEAQVMEQMNTTEAVRDLETPLEAIALNTIPKEVQKMQLVPSEDPDDPDWNENQAGAALWKALRGPKGHTPVKGTEYFTPEEVESITAEATERARPIKGEDYYTLSEKEELIDEILPLATPVKGVDYFDGEPGKPGYTPIKGKDYFDGKDADEAAILTRVLSEIPAPKPGKPGKDGSPDTPEQILKKIKGKYSWKDLKDKPDMKGGGGPGYLREITDVEILSAPANGQALVYEAARNLWKPGTVSGGAGVETVTGLNTDNTDPANPVVQISVDGVTITGAGIPGDPLVSVSGGSGDVTGPASSTDNAIARFDSTTGKIIQNSGVTISDTDVVLVPSLTASEIVITDASKNLVSASVATYPSLTELTYLKGVTSAIQTQLNAKEAALTFSTGLTRATNTITANISTGIAGSQTIYGGTAANEDLTIEGTSNATKTSSYVILQPTAGNVGIGNTSPGAKLHVVGGGVVVNTSGGAGTSIGRHINLGSVTTPTDWRPYTGSTAAAIQMENSATEGFLLVATQGAAVPRTQFITTGGYEIQVGATIGGAGNTALQILSNSNVGIGTASPLAMLTVGGTQSGNAGFEVVPGSGIVAQAYNRTAGAYASLQFDGALVGFRSDATSGSSHTFKKLTTTLAGTSIGAEFDYSTSVTNAASSFTGISLATAPVTAAASNTLRGLTIAPGAVTNASGASTYIGALITMPAITQSAGTLTSTGLRINGGTVTSGTAYALVTDASAGNVGIGTTNPSGKLDVRDGNIVLTDANVAHGVTDFGDSTSAYAKFSPLSATAGGLGAWAWSDTGTDSAYRLLAILGSADPTDTVPAIDLRGYKKNSGDIQALGSSETVLQISNATTPALTVLGSGNVGIGTTTPGANTEIYTTSTSQPTLRLNTNFASGNTVDFNPFISGVSNGGLNVLLGGTSRMVISTGGNVGIANTSPVALLTLGTAGTTAGTLSLAGGTSGVITLQTAAAAGTYTLTLPTSDGAANEFLQTDGSGVLTWAAPSVANLTGLGTGVATALAVNVGSAGAFVTFNGAGGTPSSLTLTNATGLPLSTGVTGDLPFANIEQVATNRIMGRATAGTGDIEALTASSARTVLGLSSSDSPQFTAIELGHATDTTISRSSAGVIAVEGVVIPSISSTNTITNKRNTRRLTTTNAPGATPTTNTDNVDIMNFTGLNTAITSMTTNLSGTPVDGDLLEFRFLDDGTARAITWGASFAATTIALPTTTVISTCLRALFEWRAASSKWEIVATC